MKKLHIELLCDTVCAQLASKGSGIMFELKKEDLQKNLLYIASLIFLSRALGFWQDKLFVNFFCGVHAASDAFFIAFRIPNFLRRILGEGLIAVALTPIVVLLLEQKKPERVARLLTFFMASIMSLLGLVSLMVWYNPASWSNFFAPGLAFDQSFYVEQFLPRMFFFLFFIAACEILSVWLRSINHFVTSALGPSVFHLFMIGALFFAKYFSWPAIWLGWAVSLGALVKLIVRYSAFKYFGLFLALPTRETFHDAKLVLKKMLPLLCGCGILQTHILVEGIVGSYLPVGDVSVLHYAYKIFNFPFMVLTVPISSVFLTHFSRVSLKSKLRLNFWFYEVIKSLMWLMLPIIFSGVFFATSLFKFFYGVYASTEIILKSAGVLKVLCIGLPFNALNLVCFTLFYSMKDTITPTTINAVSTAFNMMGCFIGLKYFGVWGIAASTSISHILATPVLFFILQKRYKIFLPLKQFLVFVANVILQNSIYLVLVQVLFLPGILFYTSNIPLLGYLLLGLPYLFCWLTRNIFAVDSYILNSKS